MKIQKKLLSAVIASILMLSIVVTVSADQNYLPPGMDPPPPGFVPYPTWIYVTFANNPAKLGAPQTITAFFVPPPPLVSGYNGAGETIIPTGYTNVTLFVKTPGGTTENLGNFTTGNSGGVWASIVPDELGTWTVWATWDGTMIHQPAESQHVTFEVTEEGSSMYDYPPTPYPGPNQYWETPVSGEYREWAGLVGPWYKPNFNSSNGCWNEYSTAPTTAHLLWKYQSAPAGLIGGLYGAFSYNRVEGGAANGHSKVVMNGFMYYSSKGILYCINTKTGLEKWRIMNYTGGAVMAIPAGPYGGPYGLLPGSAGNGGMLYTRVGNDLVWYDAGTGLVLRTVNIPAVWRPQIGGAGTVEIGENGACFVYWATANGNLTKWNMFKQRVDEAGQPFSGLVATFQEGIVYSINELGYRTPGVINGHYITSTSGDVRFPFVGFDTDTGALLYNVTREYGVSSSSTSGYGKVFAMCSDGFWRAWSMATGLEVWKSTYPDAYPWGYFTVYNSAAAYGNYYGLSYSGYINCFDAETGENKWNYFEGKTTETSMGHYTGWGPAAVADGKLFWSTGAQHTIASPFERGAHLICLNATTGELIWKFNARESNGDFGTKAIAEGKYFVSDGYTGYELCFAKGQTTTTVKAGPQSTVYGSSVMIDGTVKDLSPANTLAPACVSDASMEEWMEYCNINGPMPTNATGVQVTLSVLDSNNNYRDIGTVTTDPYNDGAFHLSWKPEVPGEFTVYARFAGTESYWPSNSVAAYFVVDEAPQTVQPEAPVDYSNTLYAIGAGVVAAIVIGIVAVFLVLRKR